ncbi:ubiquitin-like modifier-activating enzyme ATG7 isoform X2 [Tubulanus polymorphus]|uniref:ubiquitin-like modifier-activating enzyme ATG7 isoform X2 n=1 Tax=Tubulanus polymorphus TaxID=672921 RepID=UPI003DA6215B
MAAPIQLQFAPFSSVLDGGFWHTLSQKKLDVFGLAEEEQELHGFYSNGGLLGSSCRTNLDFSAFDSKAKTPARLFRTNGSILNTNTLDSFKSLDKKLYLDKHGKELWNDICSGDAEKNPSLLVKFHLITFANLKKYVFHYWFTFPTFVTEPVKHVSPTKTFSEKYSNSQLESFLISYDEFRQTNTDGFFLLKNVEGKSELFSLTAYSTLTSQGMKPILVFCDPCCLEKHPGWPLRNFLALAGKLWFQEDTEVEVICFRDRISDGKRDVSHSLVLHILVPTLHKTEQCPSCVGWEKNQYQKLGPRTVDLSASMDPTKLAESSVDLNLKLMRWRLLPDLNLDKIANTRCLLLGAGTLGCNVARNLMGWGVRTITFVDNAKISYSNPVRQSLFVFEDCVNGGKPKAQAAAEALRRIFPGVKSSGVTLSIPMPGHAISDNSIEQTKADVAHLERLIDEHDVVFLLMDTREARWLPTVMGASKQKLVMNAALGFDTFLVIRHGLKSDKLKPKDYSLLDTITGDQLGCYFCNDVVAPGDSTKDRTLDQQCTVSRPGISMMVSALAVELLVSVLQHPLGGEAPADTGCCNEHLPSEQASSLGIVPHQMRGFLSRFHTVLPASRAFECCTACSEIVLNAYQTDGFDFLIKAFNDPNYLEELTGLKKLQEESDNIEVWDFSDDEPIEAPGES